MITLHYYPGNASFTPHVLLHELGVPFELQLVDRAQDAHKSPAYLQLNPNGLIPTLVDGDTVLYETAAICLHLVDTHPAAQLAPPAGTAQRAEFYKWLVWMSATVQSMLMHYFYPDRMVAPGNVAGAADVRIAARDKVGGFLQQIDDQLARKAAAGPWFLGADYSVLDVYCFMLCRWTRGFSTKPARAYTHIGPSMARVLDRPAVQRAVATEQLPLPIY